MIAALIALTYVAQVAGILVILAVGVLWLGGRFA